jgi:hypothetical protein
MTDTIGPGTDRAAAVAELAAENHQRRQARGWASSMAASQEFAAGRLESAFAAADLGHEVTWDPPSGLTSIRARWTCVRPGCGKAVLQAADGSIYGSAARDRCEAVPAPAR